MPSRTVLLTAVVLGLTGHGAWALPDEVKAELSVGDGPVAAVFSDDDRVGVIVNHDDDTLSVFDTADPASAPSAVSTCSGPSGVAFATDSEAFVVACEGGLVVRETVSLASYPASLSSLTDIQLVDDADLVDVAVDGDDAWPVSGDGLIFHVDLSSSSEDTDSYFPIDLTGGGSGDDDDSAGTPGDDDDSADVVAVEVSGVAASSGGGSLVVALADGSLVDVELDDESYLLTTVYTGDSPLVDVVGDGPFYLLAEDGTLFLYETGTYAAETLAAVSEGAGLTLWKDDGDDVLAVVGGDELSFVDPDDGSGLGTVTLPADAEVVAGTADGYITAVSGDSSLLIVLTVNPWVRVLDVEPDPIDLEADISLSITSDTDGSLSVLLGGGIDASGSDLGADTSEIVADEETTATFAGDQLESSTSVLFVFVEDTDGAVGRTAVEVSSETSSEIPAPEGFTATAGDGKVTLSWAPVEVTGVTIANYVVYFGGANFDPADGDPGYCTDDGTYCSPQEVYATTSSTSGASAAWLADDDTADDDTADDDTADDDTADDDTAGDDDTSGSDTITVTMSPMTNGTVYYFAVAAVDTDEVTGTFTSVVSAMPQATGGAAWLAGDSGGYGCDGCSVAGNPMGEFVALSLLALLGAVRRMKR